MKTREQRETLLAGKRRQEERITEAMDGLYDRLSELRIMREGIRSEIRELEKDLDTQQKGA